MRSIGAAMSLKKGIPLGLQDIRDLVVSYSPGSIYVGNGTLGATDGVYMIRASDGADTVIGAIPILPADANIGAAYMTDVIKHFGRIVFKEVRLRLLPIFPSTATNMTVNVAPLRGVSNSALSVFKTDTTAATTALTVISIAGNEVAASYEEALLDLTPYIAGGDGSKQNEFNVSVVTNSTAAFGSSGFVGTNLIPCAFVVGGNNATTTLRGTTTHYVVIDLRLDLVDFVGNLVPTTVEG